MARKYSQRGSVLKFITNIVLEYDSDECLNWPFCVSDTGYGAVRIDGVKHNAHRFVCELAHGDCPPDKEQAAHRCGNRACVNPRHLRWATRSENMLDSVAHGTQTNRTLTETDVVNIRCSGFAPEQLAELYGVTLLTIQRVIRRESWRHVDGG